MESNKRMRRGRDLFKKYFFIIDILVFLYGLFPKKFQEFMLVLHRKIPGYLGLAIRYALLKNLALSVGENVSIHPDVYLFHIENLSIGNNVSIHPMSYIEAVGGVEIGDDVSIAQGTSIISFNHKYTELEMPIKDQGTELRPICIKNNVWIGAKSTILGGVKINEGSIIGAGSIVTKDVMKNNIVAGNPAKIIKKRG